MIRIVIARAPSPRAPLRKTLCRILCERCGNVPTFGIPCSPYGPICPRCPYLKKARNQLFRRPLGNSSTVEQRTLTPSILVRIQVPQPQSPIAACCTVGRPHNIKNQTSQRLSYFKPLPVPKTLTTDSQRTERTAL